MQILGEEARARVPADFIVQSPDVANPPTLFLALADMAQAVANASTGRGKDKIGGRKEDLEFLQAGACRPSGSQPAFRCLTPDALPLTTMHPRRLQRTHACKPGVAGSCALSRASSQAASDGVAVSLLRNLTLS